MNTSISAKWSVQKRFVFRCFFTDWFPRDGHHHHGPPFGRLQVIGYAKLWFSKGILQRVTSSSSKGIPQNPLNSSLGIIIIICPDNCILYCKVTLLAECASGDSALISGADEAGVMKGILYWPVDGRLVNGRSVLTWWWCLFLFKDWWQIWTSHSDVCEC